jgi:hypothetical protein
VLSNCGREASSPAQIQVFLDQLKIYRWDFEAPRFRARQSGWRLAGGWGGVSGVPRPVKGDNPDLKYAHLFFAFC